MARRAVDRRSFLKTGGLVGGGLVLGAACGPAAAPPAAKPTAGPAAAVPAAAPAAASASASAPGLRGNVTLALAQVATQLDPHKIQGWDNFFMSQVYEGLVSFNPTPSDGRGRHVPALATAWQVSPDGRTLEFELRQGARWHNGAPVTAEDVRWSFERALDPETKNPYRQSYFGQVEGVTVLGPTRVRIDLKGPDFGILDKLASHGKIASAEYFASAGENAVTRPIGSGQLKYKNYQRGQVVELEAFDEHWGGTPGVRQVTWRAVPDTNTRMSMLLAGEADLIENIPPVLASRIESAGKTVVRGFTGFQRFIFFNTLGFEPFKDRRVRYAMNIAIDRKEILRTIYAGAGAELAGPLSPYHLGYKESGVTGYPYDPARARQLLAEAGYANGFTVSLTYPPGRYLGEPELLEALAGFYDKIGIKVELQPVEYATWLKTAEEKKIAGMSVFAKGTGSVSDPPGAVSRHLICSGTYSHYCHDEIDALYTEGLSVADASRLAQIYARVQRVAHEEAPHLFLFDEPELLGLSTRVQWKIEFPVLYMSVGSMRLVQA